MSGFPVGVIILLVISVLIYLGLAHRVLDRMRLTDKAALLVVAAMIVGSFINIPITSGRIDTSINVGGALIPIGLAIYVLTRAGTRWEWGRALLSVAAAAGAVFAVNSVWMREGDPWQAGMDVIDPLFVYPLVAGGIAYLVGRSRRSAFIAGTLGVLALDIADYTRLSLGGLPGTVAVGGAGIFDTLVLSGFLAVMLAELVGESRERLAGGPQRTGRAPSLLAGLASPGRKPLSGRHQAKEDESHEE